MYAFKEICCRAERGEIELLDNRFWTPELADHRGKQVIVRFDPHDVQRGIIVETLDGRHICEAPCIARTGFNDTRKMREHLRLKKAYRRSVKASTAAKHRLNVNEVAALMARAGAPAAPAAPEASVVEIVRPKTRPAQPKPAAKTDPDQARRERNFNAKIENLWPQKLAGM